MNIGQNAARLERPNATRQPLTARITRCGPILAIRTEERRHLGRATRRPSRRFCFSSEVHCSGCAAAFQTDRRGRSSSVKSGTFSLSAAVSGAPGLCDLARAPQGGTQPWCLLGVGCMSTGTVVGADQDRPPKMRLPRRGGCCRSSAGVARVRTWFAEEVPVRRQLLGP
jgi:hypothetical protein